MMQQQLCSHDSKCCLWTVLLEADSTLSRGAGYAIKGVT